MNAIARARAEECLSDLRLDGIAVSDGAPDVAAAVHLAGCAACAGRLVDLRAEAAAWPAAGLAPEAAAPSRSRTRARSGVVRRAPWLLSTLAAAGLLIGIAVRRDDRGGDGVPADGARRKGGFDFGFFVERAGQVARFAGQVLAPGDRLRFVFADHGRREIAVISVDGAGHPSLYAGGRTTTAPVELDGERALPEAVTLDRTTGDERLIGLSCDAPVDLAPVLAALEASPRATPATPGCRVRELRFTKRAAGR